MKKLVIAIIFLATTAVWADVKLKNDTGEALDLEVKGASTVQTSIQANTLKSVGGNSPTCTILVKKAGKDVASGTFSKGDSVKIKKSGNKYQLERH